jgi:hypothetical protein
MATFTDRMLGAARLDGHTFEEIENGAGATGQALGVVALSSLAAGIGTGGHLGTIAAGVLVSIGAWYVWAFLTYLIGTRLLPEPQTRATHSELLRTIGFASAPGILRVLGVVPFLRGLVFLVAAIWMLVAGVVAVRHALDYESTWRAVGVVLIGWVIQWVILAIVFAIVGVPVDPAV